MTEPQQNEAKAHPEQATSKWEWVAAALGGLIVSATVGYMTYFGISHPEGPPNPVVEHIGTSAAEHGYLVRFRVHNAGNSTAAGLLIRGELIENGEVQADSEATIDYLPQLSEREGGLFFTQNPEGLELKLSARGYAAP